MSSRMNFINDIFERIASDASHHAHYNKPLQASCCPGSWPSTPCLRLSSNTPAPFKPSECCKFLPVKFSSPLSLQAILV
uniref:Uncharacterized protein n=1 Tax=Cyprinodon variegatus TaxID=28743 RepID=A0A3Q2C688_CYPVA